MYLCQPSQSPASDVHLLRLNTGFDTGKIDLSGIEIDRNVRDDVKEDIVDIDQGSCWHEELDGLILRPSACRGGRGPHEYTHFIGGGPFNTNLLSIH